MANFFLSPAEIRVARANRTTGQLIAKYAEPLHLIANGLLNSTEPAGHPIRIAVPTTAESMDQSVTPTDWPEFLALAQSQWGAVGWIVEPYGAGMGVFQPRGLEFTES